MAKGGWKKTLWKFAKAIGYCVFGGLVGSIVLVSQIYGARTCLAAAPKSAL